MKMDTPSKGPGFPVTSANQSRAPAQRAGEAPSRRTLLRMGVAATGALAASLVLPDLFGSPAAAADEFPPITAPCRVPLALYGQALVALDQHRDRIEFTDRIAIADFSAPSSKPRFYLVDMRNGATTSFLVAHGKGSDPDHSGWVQRFSNEEGSLCSSEGTFLTSDYYVGDHGASQRLIGLDPTNSNAEGRAIVIHSAWYASPELLLTQPMLGRSDGCFVFGAEQIDYVFDRLGPGRMLFAARI
jgi:hypothetical protein